MAHLESFYLQKFGRVSISVSHPVVSDSATTWTIARQAALERVAISFSRDLPDPGIERGSPALQADSVPLSQQGSPGSGWPGGPVATRKPISTLTRRERQQCSRGAQACRPRAGARASALSLPHPLVPRVLSNDHTHWMPTRLGTAWAEQDGEEIRAQRPMLHSRLSRHLPLRLTCHRGQPPLPSERIPCGKLVPSPHRPLVCEH